MTNPNYIILRQNQFKSDPNYFSFLLSSILKLRTVYYPFGIAYIYITYACYSSEVFQIAFTFYHSEVGGNIPALVECGKMNHQQSKVGGNPKLNLFPKIEESWKIYLTKEE